MSLPTDSAPLLGVSRSVTGHAWRTRLDAAGEMRAQVIVQQWGLPDLLARVLAGRDVAPEAAQEFLDPTVRRLMPDPSTLVAMDEAVARLVLAAERGETIGIFGDYDVDGAASSALLADFVERAGAQALVHIPDRIFEGYGPNTDAIDRFAAAGARLLVTVDCGTTSTEAIAHAGGLGLDVIVLDHHQAPEQLPGGAIIVNPNRQDDLSGLGTLCAAGVVFMTLAALNRALRLRGHWNEDRPEPNLLAELDLVALATVADVVPLTGLNRAFVVKGLELMKARGRPGLAALLDVAKAGGPPRAYHLAFLIGPRINAGGRIGDAALGAKLLRLNDPIEAARIATDQINRGRRLAGAGGALPGKDPGRPDRLCRPDDCHQCVYRCSADQRGPRTRALCPPPNTLICHAFDGSARPLIRIVYCQAEQSVEAAPAGRLAADSEGAKLLIGLEATAIPKGASNHLQEHEG